MKSEQAARRRVTIKEVAADAGVSVAAVSKVLRDAYGVSAPMKVRVNASMEKLGYRPYASARGMRGQTYTIGLVLPDLRNPFFADILAGINAALERTQYQLLLGIGQSATVIEGAIINSLIDRQMDGVILVGTTDSLDHLNQLGLQIPIVAIGHKVPPRVTFDTVNNNDRLGASLIVEHLGHNGYRNIAMLSLSSSSSTVASEREVGYRDAMETLNLANHINIVRTGRTRREMGSALKRLLEGKNKPEAVFCWCDAVAFEVLSITGELGISVPEELGLNVPKTWDEFMANNEKIKEAGRTAVVGTLGTTWTSQLFVLGDFYNVLAEEPDFAERYTAGQAKYASSLAAMRGFEHLAAVYEGDFFNPDFQAATFEEGIAMVASGGGAHYPMLTFAIQNINELAADHIDDVGFFAIPGNDPDKNGLTVWMPNGYYIPKGSQHIEEAKRFLAFIQSPEGCKIDMEAAGVSGPYLISGCDLPEDIPPSVADLQSYFQQQGTTAPALEFLSPVKGPALEQITVEVSTGARTPADAAALYDEDVRKQAQQLALPGW